VISILADQQARVGSAPARAPRSRAERLALTALLLAAAGLYLWNIQVSGWANEFYSGAVQAMTENWTAFFFGSTDAGNTITVDKPPASLWLMALSARVFGVSSWSILVPQALMGVGTVALLYAAVRRVSGPGAALVAGGLFALTPVVVLMFRFNNPDALLVLLMVAAAYTVVRALEGGRTRWLVMAGVLIGFAFLTKTAQALLPVPGLALAYLWAGPGGMWRRVRQLLAAGVAMVGAAGWWFVLAALWPADSAPYIGGSTDGSAWQLAIGYNGLGRLFGQEMSGGGAAPEIAAGEAAGSGMGGELPGAGNSASLLRMFNDAVGGQVSWLLPAALLLLVAGLIVRRRADRTDAVRAALVVWGGWLLVTSLTFSLMEGIFHEYYTVALAPGIAATAAVGGSTLWQRRRSPAARATLALAVAGTGGWAWVLLGRTPDFLPWLRWVVVGLALVAAVGLLLRGRQLAIAAVAAAVLMASLGLGGYATETVQTAHTTPVPTAGPASQTESSAMGSSPPGGMGGMGGMGGGLGSSAATVDAELITLLQDAGTAWSAATLNTSNSAALALASGTDVMGIGGFSSSDPAPTLAEFQGHVSTGDIRYFVLSGSSPTGGMDGTGGDSTSSQIQTWVQDNYTATTIGNYTVYDLTQPVAT
jgi:4-amino-4-deoxy-L-arabinose transferase-like glycosyltransferase